jgi:hypothetical protein
MTFGAKPITFDILSACYFFVILKLELTGRGKTGRVVQERQQYAADGG